MKPSLERHASGVRQAQEDRDEDGFQNGLHGGFDKLGHAGTILPAPALGPRLV